MKKSFAKSELGSIMIEALAMLGLIAMVTPILYRKTAERTTELQDINTAGELRAIIKAVDDYISAHYDAIVAGEKITNTCAASVKEQDYAALKTGDNITVPLGHFCEFLPYGVLDGSGNVNPNKIFSDYKVILKTKGGTDDKVVTGFVIADPASDSRLNELRSSSIASMIGGNGGFVTTVNDDSGKIQGNLGIWGIEDVKGELGVTGIQKNSVVAASIEGISSQTATINMDEVLYRKHQEGDEDLNTMSTDLWMGAHGEATEMYSIRNIDQLIVGAESGGDYDALYIASGDISLNSGSININNPGSQMVLGKSEFGSDYVDGIHLIEGDIAVDSGNIWTEEGSVFIGDNPINPIHAHNIGDKSLYVFGDIEAAEGFFKVDSGEGTAVVHATEYRTSIEGEGVTSKVSIKDDLVKLDTPLRVTLNKEGCSTDDTDKCALYITGDAYIDGNLTTTKTFSAKNLHAQEKLTVGGETAGTGTALTVEVSGESGANKSLDFAGGVISAETTTTEGNTSSHVNLNAGLIKATSGNAVSKLLNTSEGRYALMQYSTNSDPSVDLTSTLDATGFSTIKASGTGLLLKTGGWLASDPSIRVETPTFSVGQLTGNSDYSASAFSIEQRKLEGSGGTWYETGIRMSPDLLTITPKGVDKKFQIYGTNLANEAYIETDLRTDIDSASLNLGNGTDIGVWSADIDNNLANPDIRIGVVHKDDSLVDISNEMVTMKKAGEGASATPILKIDLTNTTDDTSDDDDYPVYIRKGAIELKAVQGTGIDTNEDLNYVKADRFIANRPLENDALAYIRDSLPGIPDSSITSPYKRTDWNADKNYQVNPAYTSIMHDIKLTSRGGARLSDILPDFINKGIYVVDNTYPAKYNTLNTGCDDGAYKLLGYINLTRTQKMARKNCTSYHSMVSPWAGFVPTPACPPGYSKVITMMPASFSIAQVGNLITRNQWDPTNDLESPDIKSIHDYSDEGPAGDTPPAPVYFQKNTWLKSFAVTHLEQKGKPWTFDGWDVGMGFVYPYEFYKEYYESKGEDAWDTRVDLSSDINKWDASTNPNGIKPKQDKDMIWNLFPVYNGTLEGYATVYCYFNRKGICHAWDPDTGKCAASVTWNESLVDRNYDQLNNFRKYHEKGSSSYINRLNSENVDVGEW